MNTVPPLNQLSRGAKFKAWLKKYWISITIILIALVGTGVFLAALGGIKDTGPQATINKPKPKPPQKYFSNLTGEQVGDEAATKQAVTGVMIENSSDSRPQSGLKKAGVVYETVAEGGITRFIALYQHDKPELIGPVRSLRIYYLDWAAPYQV